MLKQVHFGDFSSFDDFSLILSAKKIETPKVKTETTDVPGADGVLDFTEYFGEPKYENRKLSFDFSTMTRYDGFLELFSQIQNALHGQRLNIWLDDDPDFYYVGRISVSEWQADKRIGKVTIECDCEPYKYKRNQTKITTEVSGSASVVYRNLRKSVTPQFDVSVNAGENMTVKYGAQTYSLSSGTFRMPELVFYAGDTVLDYEGNGTVTVTYQEGGL